MLRLQIFSVSLLCLFISPISANAAIVFSNDFEDGNLLPEIGTATLVSGSSLTSVVPTSVAGTALGGFAGLFDQNATASTPLDLTLNLTDAVTLTGGNTVTLDFDVVARRTAGNTKTIFVDAMDSNGDIVTRFVLGDQNAFGNNNADRQRPGYDPSSAGADNTGNSTFGSPPGSFWWGSDGTPATLAGAAAGHMSLTFGASSFDFSSTKSFGGPSFSTTTSIANYNDGTFDDIAEFQLTSVGGNYGAYFDNIEVNGVIAVPEPSSFALLGVAGLGFIRRRRKA